jgi:hypothetical protein
MGYCDYFDNGLLKKIEKIEKKKQKFINMIGSVYIEKTI